MGPPYGKLPIRGSLESPFWDLERNRQQLGDFVLENRGKFTAFLKKGGVQEKRGNWKPPCTLK